MATEPITIDQRIARIASELEALRGREARLSWLVARGRIAPSLADEFRTEHALVPGCLARLWLVGSIQEGRCRFLTASDSQVVQGLAALLCELATGSTPAELAATPGQALEPLHLERLLTSNRRDAASRLWEAMRAFSAERCKVETAQNAP